MSRGGAQWEKRSFRSPLCPVSETLGSLAYLVRAKKGDGLEVPSTNQLDAEEPVQHKRQLDTMKTEGLGIRNCTIYRHDATLCL